MRLLINLNDIRKYSQFSKEANTTARNGHIFSVQENQLQGLLKPALYYDLFNYLNNDWLSDATVYERVNDTQIKAIGVDLSAFAGYALRIDNSTFVTVKSAVFGIDTVLTVEGNNLTNEENSVKYVPDTFTTIEYKDNSDYLKLLNGTTYIYNRKINYFNGLRPYLIWHFLNVYLILGDNKQADVGNISLIDESFMATGGGNKKQIGAQYLQNATQQENLIIQYLNEESSTFANWEGDTKSAITQFNISFI